MIPFIVFYAAEKRRHLPKSIVRKVSSRLVRIAEWQSLLHGFWKCLFCFCIGSYFCSCTALLLLTYCETPGAAVAFLVKLCNLKSIFTFGKASFERLKNGLLERLCLDREIIFFKFPTSVDTDKIYRKLYH